MELILKSLIPLVFIISIGWVAGWRNIIDNRQSGYFASYVMNFSFPCTLFLKTATSSIDDLINVRFIGGFAVGLMGMYILALIVNRYVYHRHLTESCQSAFVSSFPDMAFMGIPIFTVLFGENALISIVVGNIITSLIMIPLTVVVLEVGQNTEKRTSCMPLILKVFKKPLVLAPLLGTLLATFGFKVPTLVADSLKMFGGTTSGVSLFALGLIMSTDRICFNKFVLLNIFHKNILHPLLMWAIVIMFGISGEWAREAILLCAMPPAIMTTMFAAKYGVLRLESSSSTVLGTIVSLFTMAIIMYMMEIGT